MAPMFRVEMAPGHDGSVIVSPVGELDLATCDEFEQAVSALIGGGHRKVALDLSGLAFVDSTGLSVLVTLRALLQHAGGELVAYRPTAAVAKILETTGLDRLLINDTADDEKVG